MRKNAVIQILFCASLLLTACAAKDDGSSSRLALMKTTDPEPVETQDNNSKVSEQDVKKDVASLPELYDVAVIKGKKDILVAYKVKHLKRFNMKGIEKRLTAKLEKKYPKENFTVSSDYKIFLEATRLQEGIKSGKYNDKEAEKRLQQIIKLQKEKA